MSQAGSFATSGGGGGLSTINGDVGSATGSTINLHALNGTINTTNCGASVLFTGSGAELDLTVTDPNSNTFIGQNAGADTSISGAGNNTCLGVSALHSINNASASANIAIGFSSLFTLLAGANNVCIGNASGVGIEGSSNTFVGHNAFAQATSGSSNVAVGAFASNSILTGSFNIFMGFNAAAQYTTSESSNILIGNIGVTGESNVMRLGTSGSSDGQVNSTFVAGIDGVAVVGSTVLCSTSGQLGDVVSSIKLKENVQDISSTANSILNCRPVSFNYISDKAKTKCFGMIAEEVNEIFPDLVIYKNGEPYSIKYHEMPVLLLAEIQKLKAEVESLKKRIS